MKLDDRKQMQSLDTQGMLGCIDRLPDQLEEAWQAGQGFPLPETLRSARQVVIAGMGGSAIGGALLSAYAASFCEVPILVWRDYGLPAWMKGPDTLVIASSYSGNTEETLSAYQAARERKCSLLAMTTGGKLAAKAGEDGVPLWKFTYSGQPRSAVGYTFALPLAMMARLKLIPDPAKDVAGAAAAMRAQQKLIGADTPLAGNPAKRMASLWFGRNVIVFGADILTPIARRWKGQISEIAKAWAQFEELPELDHNTVAGTIQPKEIVNRSVVVFLRSRFDHPRNSLRTNITQDLFRQQGWTTEIVEAAGDAPLAQMYSCLHFGDYSSYYLAMAYDTDPSPVAVIEDLKKRLAH
jgi:glucose/mannose-6-phosphate isomerase